MAITDNLAILIKAEAGQSVITDSIAALTVDTGAGTVTLMEDATYGYFWRLTGGLKSAVLSGMGEWMKANSTTVAMRFRVSNRAANYSRFMIMGSNTDSGLMIGNGGTPTGVLRVGVQVGGSTIGSVAPPTYTSGDMMTAVIRFVEGATDAYSGWYKTVDRVGTDPNYSATSTTASAYRARALLQFLTASENLDIFDYAMLTRGVTNAEGAALADDIRATLYPSSATDATTTGGTGTSTGSGSGGDATGSSGGTDATTTGGTGTSTGSGSGGSATGAASATITLRAIDFTTSELRVSETGVEAIINALTGALVLRQTGLSIDASGNCPVTNVAFTSGTEYRCTTIHSDGSEGTWRYTAV